MRITLVHPCIGRRPGEKYMRTWQMEPLPAAVLAGLTPQDVEIKFYDDRMESIPFDEPTDGVALSVETYTAKRAYQIATEYRKRGVPVIMGGFHATLCPEDAGRYAEALVIGEAEGLWPELVDDLRHGTLKRRYSSASRPSLAGLRPDRGIFRGKKYLPVGLVELGRGCKFKCDFCAIQAMFQNTNSTRPIEEVVEEVKDVGRRTRLLFFVDDNMTADPGPAKRLFELLAPLQIPWVSQTSIQAAQDDELLDLMASSGCKGVLIGFESLEEENLAAMNKAFNTARGGYETALAKFYERGISVYGTFLFGYDYDTHETFRRSLEFAKQNGLFITAFNHVTPFPGTPLYQRLASENRLLSEAWWLDEDYSYGQVPFKPANMTPEELEQGCFAARRAFYAWPSIFRRGLAGPNRAGILKLHLFLLANFLHRSDIAQRIHHPLGDQRWKGELLCVQ